MRPFPANPGGDAHQVDTTSAHEVPHHRDHHRVAVHRTADLLGGPPGSLAVERSKAGLPIKTDTPCAASLLSGSRRPSPTTAAGDHGGPLWAVIAAHHLIVGCLSLLVSSAHRLCSSRLLQGSH